MHTIAHILLPMVVMTLLSLVKQVTSALKALLVETCIIRLTFEIAK